ncbi:MAG TPA: thiamine pyrophosphate-binding protein [Solirubrobacterales bacterium]
MPTAAPDPTVQPPPTGAASLAAALGVLNIQRVYGQPGVHNLAAWSAIAAQPIRMIGVRHEQTAVYAADGETRTRGGLGVALTTTGPGAANAVSATGEAWASGSPVLVLATDIPTTLRRQGVYRGVLHESTDQGAMFDPVVKARFKASSAAEIGPLVLRAAAIATTAPMKPVYLEIPTDLLTTPIDTQVTPPETLPPPSYPVPSLASFTAAAELLVAARRPLIWAGGGAVRSDSSAAVGRLAELLGAPVIETYQGKGLLPLGHPAKVAIGPHLPQIGGMWDDADVVIAVGTDFDGMMTQNWLMPQPPALIVVNVDEADAVKAYRPDVTLRGDAAPVLARLAEMVEAARQRPADGFLGEVAAREAAARREVREESAQAADFLETMRGLPIGTSVVADMCIPGYWLGSFHPVADPGGFAYPVGWGTLGSGFPLAIGASFATDGAAVAVCGDGGFLFACGELAMVAEERPPLTVLILDNGGYGMLRFDQVHAGQKPLGVDLVRPDFVSLARSFGLTAHKVSDVGAPLAGALTDAIASREPRVITVDIEMTPPPNTSPRWYRQP